MKNYTVFYGETNTAYSVPTSAMTIIENTNVNEKCENGRLVFTNNTFVK